MQQSTWEPPHAKHTSFGMLPARVLRKGELRAALSRKSVMLGDCLQDTYADAGEEERE